MITIKQLLQAPVGKKAGGIELSIKTYKKTWQVGDVWFSQVILMDETGEIPADVNVGKTYNPIRGRGSKIRIVVCEVQEAEYLGKDRRKLYVSEYSIPTMTMTEYEEEQDALELKWGKEVAGKIRHGHSCQALGGLLKKGTSLKEAINEILANKPEIEKLIEYIITGE
jgi:hypothetical protein